MRSVAKSENLPLPGQSPCAILLPGLAWAVGFILIPMMLVLVLSLATRGTYGGVRWQWTLVNYVDLVHPLYGRILVDSIIMAGSTTLICLVLGYPLAYHMSRASRRWQVVWLMAIMIPFWSNFLIRTYAWMFVLRTEGFMNTVLLEWRLIQTPIDILYTKTAVLVGLVYGYLPFMVLPLYVAMERMDRHLVEAAYDLYASRSAVFWHIIVPVTKPGLVAGSLLVFLPTLGAFITPDLLGGARTMMVGNLIQHEYLVVRDWPLGSAISLVLIGIVGMGVAASVRLKRWWVHAGMRT